MKTFDILTKTLQHKLEELTKTLENRKALVASDSLTELGYTFRQRADDVMKEAETLRYLERITVAHANVCRMAIDENVEMDHHGWWNAKAQHLTKWIAQDCMSTVIRGVSTSSNPMYLIEEMMKVAAAKDVFSTFVSGYMEGFFDGDAFDDVFDGMKRREEEREAARLKRVAKIVVTKVSGRYVMEAQNYRGDFLERKYTELTSKPLAKAAAEEWATYFRAKQEQSDGRGGWVNPYINVEFN